MDVISDSSGKEPLNTLPFGGGSTLKDTSSSFLVPAKQKRKYFGGLGSF